MSENNKEVSSLRKGVIIFFLLIAIIIAIGGYLYNQSRNLNQYYEQILASFYIEE